MQHSETLGKIAPALVKALGEMEAVAKSAANPHFKSKFTPLDEVIETSRPILAANKLALMQFPGMLDGNKLGLETVIMHESGEWISGLFEIAVSKLDPQQVGSAISYARRYAQKAALNLADMDDDANGSMPAKPVSAYQAKKNGLGPRADAMIHEIRTLESQGAVNAWVKANLKEIESFPANWQTQVKDEVAEQRKWLEQKEAEELHPNAGGGFTGRD